MKIKPHKKCLDCEALIPRHALRCNACAYETRKRGKKRASQAYRDRQAQQRAAAARANDDRRVIVRIDEDGLIEYHVGSGVELLIVDEGVPTDRVYRWSGVATADEIDSILSDDPVGHRFDDSENARKLGQRLN